MTTQSDRNTAQNVSQLRSDSQHPTPWETAVQSPPNGGCDATQMSYFPPLPER